MNNSIIVRESEANREPSHCHCEERSDEAISKTILLFLSPYSRQASEVENYLIFPLHWGERVRVRGM